MNTRTKRLKEIEAALKNKEPLSCKVIQEKYNIARRTVCKDITTLRRIMGCNIKYDPVLEHYVYLETPKEPSSCG